MAKIKQTIQTITEQPVKSANSLAFRNWAKIQFCLFLGLSKAQFAQYIDWGKDTGKLIYIPQTKPAGNLPEIGIYDDFPYLFFSKLENPGFRLLEKPKRLIYYFDVITAIGWILAGYEEYHATKRDRFGRWAKENSILFQNDFTNKPRINDWIKQIKSYLTKNKISLIPLWPKNKTWAVALTHDVEGVNFEPVKSLKNIFKAVLKLDLVYLRFSLTKLASTIIFTITDGWHFKEGFNDLIEALNKLKVKPTLFICGARQKTSYLSFNDPDYDLHDKGIIESVKFAVKSGFSIGVHPVIQTAPSTERYKQQVGYIEENAKIKIRACRHHYWNVSRRDTADAFFAMSQAGIKYDTSLSFYDEPNFRRSIVLPFQPFHPKLQKTIPILEIPSTFMDQWSSLNPESFIKQLNMIKNINGVAVLDWHSNRFSHHYYQKQRELFIQTVAKLKKNDQVWLTDLESIGNWWEKRTKKLNFFL